jgi:hypothetical protein
VGDFVIYDLRLAIYYFFVSSVSFFDVAQDGICVNLRLLTIFRCLFVFIRG